jgi:hypothetical protein
LKKDVGNVALRITDAAGRDVREISGNVLRNSNKAGIQAACWDLRVQPVPNPNAGQQQGRGGGRQGGPGQDDEDEPQQVRFGAGCTGGGGGGFGGGGGGNPGPFVLPGTYTVALVVDGKTVGTKPLRVMADPEVVLTQAERKRLYDMAMDLHDLQRRVNTVAERVLPIRQQLPEVMKQVGSKTDLPADVKAQAESFNKEFTELANRIAPQGGGRGRGGFGGGGGTPSPVARAAQAKNGLMGGMWPTQMTMDAYNEAKTGVPAAIAEANTMIGKAEALSAALAKHGIKLEVPAARVGTRPE